MSSYDLSEFKNKKIALVLSGGVVKAAAWHIGVALALEELGFTLKSNRNSSQDDFAIKRSLEVGTYVGSSAGAMIGAFLSSGFTPQEIINGAFGLQKGSMAKISYKDMFYLNRGTIPLNPFKKKAYHPQLEGFPPFLQALASPFLGFPGFFSTEGLQKYLTKEVLDSDRFEDLAPDLFIVASQLNHSQKTIFSKYNYPNPSHDSTAVYQTGVNISVAAAASMTVPGVYAPFPVTNPKTGETEHYIDGEIRETLSTHVAEDNGCDIIISSWTHTPYHYHDEIGSLANYGIPSIALQALYLLIQKKIVASRAKRATGIDILNTVSEYMRQEKFSTAHRRDIMAMLERKMNINPNVKLIDIYPDHHDYKLFFSSSFSLSPKTASHAVKAGYKRAMQVLSQPEFL